MKKKYFYILLVAGLLSGCASLNYKEMMQLANCEYNYHSVNNIEVANVNVSNNINLLTITKISTALLQNSKSIPLDFILNVDVKNPGTQKAAINKVYYQVYVDDNYIADGYSVDSFAVYGGQTNKLPIQIRTDLASLISNETGTSAINIIKRILGFQTDATKFTVKIKPVFYIKQTEFTLPTSIPISFTLKEKK